MTLRHHIGFLQQAQVVLLLRRHIMQSRTPSRHTKLSQNKTARLRGACLEADVVEEIRQVKRRATHGEVAGLVDEPRPRRKRRPQEYVVVVPRVFLRRQGMQSQAQEELLHHRGMPSQGKTKQLSYGERASRATWRRRMVR